MNEPTPKKVGTDPAFPEVIDNTMLSVFKQCEKRFYYEHCIHISSAGISPDLHAGGAVAAGLEAARNAIYRDKLSTEQGVAEGIRVLTEFYGDYIPPERSPKTYLHCCDAIIAYFEMYPPETDPVQPYETENGMAIEFTFAIPTQVLHPVTGNPILYGGRADMVGNFGDAIFVVDDKTCKAAGKAWNDKWDLRSQFLGYSWACRYHGIKTTGSIVRGIKFLMGGVEVLPQVISYTEDWKIDRWFQMTNHMIQRMVWCWENNYYPQDLDEACNMYGGCQFKQLCKSNQPEVWMPTYVTREWNPLDKDPSHSAEQIAELPMTEILDGSLFDNL